MATNILTPQTPGLMLEKSLRKSHYQTDRLTNTIARNQQSLERFARKYGLTRLLNPQARGMFAAMSCTECGHFLEFLQYSIHAGYKSMHTRGLPAPSAGYSEQLVYLAAVANRPQLIGDHARQIFRGMTPDAKRIAAMILLAAWQIACGMPTAHEIKLRHDALDRMVSRLEQPVH